MSDYNWEQILDDQGNVIGFEKVAIESDAEKENRFNTIKSFKAGCNIVLHCNGNLNEMKIVAENSPLISSFIIKKTSQFYKILR